MPRPGRPARAADQRRALGPRPRPPGRARHHRRLRRRPLAGGARPAARLRQPARRPRAAAARVADGSLDSLAALFAQSADAQAEVTNTLGTQVRQAVELLVGELSRLDRESAGTLLGAIAPRQIYRGALTVMMRLVFLLYAEEQRLLPVQSDLYASSYSVSALYDQLQAERNLYGDEVGDRRAAAWPRLLATFAAVYGGCEHDEMRIPPYGGGMFDPSRYPWLDRVAVTDLVDRRDARRAARSCSARAAPPSGCPTRAWTSSRSATSTRACSSSPACGSTSRTSA